MLLQLGSRISCKLQQEDAGWRSGKMVVHVGSMPLRAPPGPAQWALLSADRTLSIQHFYTVLQPISASPSEQHPCVVFDFQPQNPEDLFTVLTGLSGGVVPGVILKRTIMRPPVRRCWKVGMAKEGLSMMDAADFNKKWDCRLRLWTHDCRHHTNALVEFLTGEKEILRKLRMF